jgi:hypothetical protein
MVTFPNLHNFYKDGRKNPESKSVNIRLQTDVTAIVSRSRDGVVIEKQPYFEVDCTNGTHPGSTSRSESFDELLLCILADDALRILGKIATWRERFVLGGAKFFDDITITHSDDAYFQKHYETKIDPVLCAEPKSKAQENQIAYSKGEQRGKE